MKKIALIAAGLMALSAFGCTKEEKKEEPKKPVVKVEPKVTIPPYNPTGENAALMKAAAAGITKDNAEMKAKEIEAALDKAITELSKPKDG